MRGLAEIGAWLGYRLATRPQITDLRLSYELGLPVEEVTALRARLAAVLPPATKPAYDPFTRAGLLAWHMAQRTLSMREIMELIGQPRQHAHALLITLSLAIPVYDFGRPRRWGCDPAHKHNLSRKK